MNGLPMGHNEIACSIRGIVSVKGRCGSFTLKPACVYCKKNPSAEDGNTNKCRKLRKFLDKGKCSAFRYDPDKHSLMLNPIAVTPESPVLPDPPKPPKPSKPQDFPNMPKPPVSPIPPIAPKPPVFHKPLNFNPPPIAPVPPLNQEKSNNTDYSDAKADREAKSKWEQKLESVYSEEEKELWAKPTLITDCGTEGLIKVFEVSVGAYAKKETIRNRTWIHDIFDDNGVEYYIEMELKHQGKQSAEVQSIYVRPEEKDNASFLIWTFSKADFVAPEYTPDVATQNMVDGIPQKQCMSCGEEIDFDYHTCPYCKAAF